MTREWRPCCPYREGIVVVWGGMEWVAIRRTGKGETPGESGAWEPLTAYEAARAVDPRIGVGA